MMELKIKDNSVFLLSHLVKVSVLKAKGNLFLLSSPIFFFFFFLLYYSLWCCVSMQPAFRSRAWKCLYLNHRERKKICSCAFKPEQVAVGMTWV